MGRIVDDVEESSVRRWLRRPIYYLPTILLDFSIGPHHTSASEAQNRWLTKSSSVAINFESTLPKDITEAFTNLSQTEGLIRTSGDTTMTRLPSLPCFLSNLNTVRRRSIPLRSYWRHEYTDVLQQYPIPTEFRGDCAHAHTVCTRLFSLPGKSLGTRLVLCLSWLHPYVVK